MYGVNANTRLVANNKFVFLLTSGGKVAISVVLKMCVFLMARNNLVRKVYISICHWKCDYS